MKRTIIIIVAILFISCVPLASDYKLTSPQKSYVLPVVLNEISGIVPVSANEIACVQDESGHVFIFDLKSASITQEYNTGLAGDYEGITLVGNTIYLLRSDGILVEYPDFRSPGLKIKEYFLNLPSSNNEGLCYDQKNYRLLIAAKIKAGKGKENKDERYIYSFDLKSKVPSNTPLFKLHVEDIEAYALKRGIQIPYRTNKKTGKQLSAFNFRPSEIAVHPFNKDIYILSANDKLLLVTDEKGAIKDLESLNPVLFNKAEGLAFLPDGTMLISNEAQQRKPTLLTFSYSKPH